MDVFYFGLAVTNYHLLKQILESILFEFCLNILFFHRFRHCFSSIFIEIDCFGVIRGVLLKSVRIYDLVVFISKL